MPDGLSAHSTGDLSASGPESAMFLERRFRLGPGESRTLTFVLRLPADGFELDSLLATTARISQAVG